MSTIRIVTVTLLGMMLCACDKAQQQVPPPTYQSTTLEAARTISGVQAQAPASAASGGAAK